MIIYKEVDKSFFELYDKITMNVDVNSEYRIKRIDKGLGGLIMEKGCLRVMGYSCCR